MRSLLWDGKKGDVLDLKEARQERHSAPPIARYPLFSTSETKREKCVDLLDRAPMHFFQAQSIALPVALLIFYDSTSPHLRGCRARNSSGYGKTAIPHVMSSSSAEALTEG